MIAHFSGCIALVYYTKRRQTECRQAHRHHHLQQSGRRASIMRADESAIAPDGVLASTTKKLRVSPATERATCCTRVDQREVAWPAGRPTDRPGGALAEVTRFTVVIGWNVRQRADRTWSPGVRARMPMHADAADGRTSPG